MFEWNGADAPGRSTILGVDDDPSIREIVMPVLRDEGYRGAAGFLTKPFELDDLLEVVAGVLSTPVPPPR